MIDTGIDSTRYVKLANGHEVDVQLGQVRFKEGFISRQRIVNLTEVEWALFSALYWEGENYLNAPDANLRTQIRRLRAKLGEGSIENRFGFGYRLRLADGR